MDEETLKAIEVVLAREDLAAADKFFVDVTLNDPSWPLDMYVQKRQRILVDILDSRNTIEVDGRNVPVDSASSTNVVDLITENRYLEAWLLVKKSKIFTHFDVNQMFCHRYQGYSIAALLLGAQAPIVGKEIDSLKSRLESQRSAYRKHWRNKVTSLIEKYEFDQASIEYAKWCSCWWSADEFANYSDQAKLKKVDFDRQHIGQQIDRLLGDNKFDEATLLYEAQCRDWMPQSEIEAKLTEARAVYRAKLNEAAKQARLKIAQQIDSLLDDFRFDDATHLYEAQCRDWMPQSEIEAKLTEARAVHRAKLNEATRQEVLSLLDGFDFNRANELYRSQCSDWWPESDYRRQNDLKFLEYRSRSYEDDFVALFEKGGLRSLDEFFLALPEWLQFSKDEFVSLKLPLIRHSLGRLNITLDAEQTNTIAQAASRILIRARAGAGKTKTLCARASVAIYDECLDANQVLMLAFNKSAAGEICQRMRKDFGCPTFENARTFHSLAYQLAIPRKTLLFDEGHHPSQRAQSGFVQMLLERILDPAFKELLYQFFRKEIEEVERLGRDLPPDEYKAFRRSLEQVSLKGGRVKSAGEKFIADFLFEHDISNTYERIWAWGEFEQGQPYKPNFTLVANGSDFIVEHWAFDPRDKLAQLPADWGITADQYRQQIARKRMFWANKDVPLIETHGGDIADGREAFELVLKQRLENAGIRCQRLPDEELIRRVFETNFQISRMAEQFMQFIQRAKKRCLSANDVAQLIADRSTRDQRLNLFYELALEVYREYETALAERGAMDFDDLLGLATEEVVRNGSAATIRLGGGRFVRIGDLKWLLVDEYQDFSELYYRLLSAVLRANPDIRLMAVGDDWQAINGFAGAELRFFADFTRYFPGAGDATIATNYRSARTVVRWGNRLMDGLGPEARPREEALTGETRVVDLTKEWIEFRRDPQYEDDRLKDAVYFGIPTDDKNPGMALQRLARVLKVCVRLFQQTKTGRLLLLSRTKRAYGLDLGEFRNRLVETLATLTGEDQQILRKKIRVMTAHTAKGQEEEAVVILDASQTNFPKVHPDNLLYEIFGVTPADVLAEEQRLFYVAITRPAETLWILTEGDTASLYVKRLTQPAAPIRYQDPNGKQLDDHQPPSEIYLRIKERLDALPAHVEWIVSPESSHPDPWAGTIEDVIDGLKPVTEDMRSIGNVPLPRVAFELDDSGEFIGELAWPDLVPPLVVLAGEQVDQRERWRSDGWMVLTADSAIRKGGKWLADQLTLLGDLPPEKPHLRKAMNPHLTDSQPDDSTSSLWRDVTTYIAGVRHSLGNIVPSERFQLGDILSLQREPTNQYDSNAVMVLLVGQKVGYLPRGIAGQLAATIDRGASLPARVTAINDANIHEGVQIVISVPDFDKRSTPQPSRVEWHQNLDFLAHRGRIKPWMD
jgi:DNA helicase-4